MHFFQPLSAAEKMSQVLRNHLLLLHATFRANSASYAAQLAVNGLRKTGFKSCNVRRGTSANGDFRRNRPFPTTLVSTLSYVGSKGTYLLTTSYLNLAIAVHVAG